MTLSHLDWPGEHFCTYVAWTYTDREVRHTHDQDYYELFWVESGAGIHRINQQDRVMEPGYLVLIRPEDEHGFCVANHAEALRFINFAFRPESWCRVREIFYQNKTRYFDIMDIHSREFQVEIDERERLRMMAGDLAAGRWTRINAEAFLHGVLALLSNRGANAFSKKGLPDWMAHALRTFEKWPHFCGGVPEFVRLAGRSPEHVSRDCRRLLGVPPREIVRRTRLKWACMQLSTTEKKVIDIAQECGFENLGHFYKVFRSEHGVSPREYRLQFGIRERE